jgi:hypothetical protein
MRTREQRNPRDRVLVRNESEDRALSARREGRPTLSKDAKPSDEQTSAAWAAPRYHRSAIRKRSEEREGNAPAIRGRRSSRPRMPVTPS